MKIKTKYHGLIDYNQEDVFQFPNGIPGFMEEKEFLIIPFSEDRTFLILQSTKTPELGFVLTNPFSFNPQYDFNLEEQAVETLDLESEKDVLVYSILTIAEPFQNTTANLQAPIILNSKKNLGKQVILTGTSYQTKHKLFSEGVVK
ncbi:flagellar assembly protein FliW [Sutcliffiella rhizosphaerae]|uniref:Flagellar assembly factor FliW n=1 Tax=Sutcliffiella rhizosphaerae TaxID=2880967 RepID=A0ABM8YN70_9BACI|nr:flagellar assembly protein FliW [Sutcliffiella rhizosphaerae]CAG9621436.1 Flagellar assembly factor FliW [Sutcliffiella rhizosphaerae]